LILKPTPEKPEQTQ